MKPTHDMATGETALIALVDSMSGDSASWNEADTRHRFIDVLIHDVLGWDRAATGLERHEGGEYSDYELGNPPEVVIEAKRAGVSFEIPHEGATSVLRSIRSLTSMSRGGIEPPPAGWLRQPWRRPPEFDSKTLFSADSEGRVQSNQRLGIVSMNFL